MANELPAAAKWLYGKLIGDAALTALVSNRVYADVAPTGAAFPYVVFSITGVSDLQAMGPDRAAVTVTMVVRAVTQGSSTVALEPVASRVDELLQVKTPTTVSLGGRTYNLLSCARQTALAYPETVEGKPYRHLGGLYVMMIDEP